MAVEHIIREGGGTQFQTEVVAVLPDLTTPFSFVASFIASFVASFIP